MYSFARMTAIHFCGLSLSLLTALATEAQTVPTNNLPAEGDQVLRVFRDFQGREMEEVLMTRNVTEYRTEMKEVKETRVVQEWVTEQQPVAANQVTPVVQYEARPRWKGRFNPFVQPTLTYDYVPVTTYQNNPVASTVPVSIPKWVSKEVPVMVPQVVPSPRSVQYRVIRPRMQSNGNGSYAAAIPARQNPSQMAANQAMTERNLPSVATNPILPSTTPIVPTSVASYGYPPTVPLGSVGPQPLINPGNFLNGGRLVNANWNRPWNAPATASPSINTLPIANSQPLYQPARPMLANKLLRPITAGSAPNYGLPRIAAIPGNGTWREPSQLGLRPTELR